VPPLTADRPIVILGAGLSGLSLALALRERGSEHPVLLIDRRRRWDRDRTWCTWQTGPLRFSDAITHRWEGWRTQVGPDSVTTHSSAHPYVHIDAGRVYASALDRLAPWPNVEIRLGEGVLGVEPGPVPVVHTTAGSIQAALVLDAMGASSPLAPRRPPGATAFAQRFSGWEVEVDRPVFDPAVATLMDFRPHAGTGTTFMYVLAFSTTRALLEHTSIEPYDAPRVDREAALEHELRTRWGLSDWRVLRRERGLIPMTSSPFPAHRGEGVHTLGTAAGAIRPSSGYAFSRIQRQADAVAAAIVAGRPLPKRIARPRTELLDRIFLHALAHSRHPEALFLASASVDGDAYARFMTDASSPADEARFIASLPVAEMTRAALGSILSGRAFGRK
jgi:lycopene beta-cyclase